MAAVARTNQYEVDNKTECWNWLLGTRNGYGLRKISGKMVSAHRHSYEEKFGTIPEGKVLDHLCRNRKCVNPSHLEPTTLKINSQRGAQSKLTQILVDDIRLKYQNGYKQVSLAQEYGVGQDEISRIVNRLRW